MLLTANSATVMITTEAILSKVKKNNNLDIPLNHYHSMSNSVDDVDDIFLIFPRK